MHRGPIHIVGELGDLVAAVDDQTVGFGWDGQPFLVGHLNLETGRRVRRQYREGTPIGVGAGPELSPGGIGGIVTGVAHLFEDHKGLGAEGGAQSTSRIRVGG